MGTRGSETSQYPEEKKSTEIPLVVASERGLAQTGWHASRGRGTSTKAGRALAELSCERQAKDGNSPVGENAKPLSWHPSRAGHVKSGLNLGGPPSKAKYYPMTDSEPVP